MYSLYNPVLLVDIQRGVKLKDNTFNEFKKAIKVIKVIKIFETNNPMN